ncbi:MAG: hypothetical protein ACTHOO_04805 [Alcanivorax sp.]
MVNESIVRLRKKTGTGKISPELIKRASRVLAANNVDFIPMGRVFVTDLGDVIERLEESKSSVEAMRPEITKCVMELKANSTMFGFDLIGDMSAMLLSLIETTKKIDRNLVSLLNVYHKSCKAMVSTKMSGDGGEMGKEILEEFTAACDRYERRRRSIA